MTKPLELPCKAEEKRKPIQLKSQDMHSPPSKAQAYTTYQSLVDLARVWPPFLAIAVDGATAIDGELVDPSEHDPVPPVLVAPVRPVRRRHQRALHRERDAGLARATEGDELEQVAPAVGDEHDGRPWRGARRLPRLLQRRRVVVPPVATGAVAVEAEHALVVRR